MPTTTGTATRLAPPTTQKQLPAERSHPDLIQMHISSEDFSNFVTSKVDLPRGSLFARLEPSQISSAPKATYQTVQSGRNSHIMLHSDLVFIDHSCAPALVFDMSKMEVRVVEDRDLHKSDVLTFFYPSTEWDSAQPFVCRCGAGEKCLGTMRGAKELGSDVLDKYWINEHILELARERDAQGKN